MTGLSEAELGWALSCKCSSECQWLFEASPLTWLEAVEDGCCWGPQLSGYLHMGSPCGLPFFIAQWLGSKSECPMWTRQKSYGFLWPSFGSHVTSLLPWLQAFPDSGQGNTGSTHQWDERQWHIVKRAWCGIGNVVILLDPVGVKPSCWKISVTFSIIGKGVKKKEKEKKRRKRTLGLVGG